MIMKRIFQAICMAGLLTASSCSNYLETVPTDFVSPENYFNNEKEAFTALTAAYEVLGKTGLYGRYLYFEMDVADDSFVALPSWTQDIALFNYSPGDVKLEATWSLLYSGINRANVVIENVDKIAASDNVKKVMKGEAYFLRGYYHFLLAQNWGDVPLKLASTKSVAEVNNPRTPYKLVYEQVVKDMEMAADMVAPAKTYSYAGRVTQPVVWGVLARVNLKMAGAPLRDQSRWAEAAKWAKKVIDLKANELNPDYTRVFKNMCENVYDVKESMWEVEFGRSGAGTQDEEGALGSINGIGTSNTAVGYSYGAKHTTVRYYRLFEEGDLRRDWNINTYYYTSATNAAPINWTPAQIYQRCDAKWRREFELVKGAKFTGTTTINFPLLRFADVLLMFAEADNEANSRPSADAYAAVNLVRERAFGLLGNVNAATVHLQAGLNVDDFRTAVRKERALELGYEGLRRFDLVRWGQYISTMKDVATEIATTGGTYAYGAKSGQNISERDTLFAIPASELSLNPGMKPNNGW